MSHVMCPDVSCCFIGSRTSRGNRIHFRVCIEGLHSCLLFTFAIRDTIGDGMTWGDVMMNAFTFYRESHWLVTKSVGLNELP